MYIQKMGPVLVRLVKELSEKQESEPRNPSREDRAADDMYHTSPWFFGTAARADKSSK
ncbi:MAG: hypothetical protein RIM72_13210 [Alphaproteobacteria bacterium]